MLENISCHFVHMKTLQKRTFVFCKDWTAKACTYCKNKKYLKKNSHVSMLFEHRKRLQKRIYLLCKHGQGFQKTVLTRGHILFTLHRVWCLLNCGLHPQNSQLLTKRTLLAFNALSLVLLKEDAWAFGCGCSLNGSMNKNLKSEEKIALCKTK